MTSGLGTVTIHNPLILAPILAFAALTALGACNGCDAQKPAPATPESYQDATPTNEELAKSPDACVRAGKNLEKVCPELWKSEAHWLGFCHQMVADKIPICATKLARAKDCTEARSVCQ